MSKNQAQLTHVNSVITHLRVLVNTKSDEESALALENGTNGADDANRILLALRDLLLNDDDVSFIRLCTCTVLSEARVFRFMTDK